MKSNPFAAAPKQRADASRDAWRQQVRRVLEQLVADGCVVRNGDKYSLTQKGLDNFQDILTEIERA